MALNTGINSLDAGAPDIKYTGREGPQDPRTAGASDYLQYVQAMNALGEQPMPIDIFQSLEGIMSVQEMVNMGSPEKKAQGGITGTYTQRRRNQMAYGGIAGLDGRKAYGIGSWFQEKIKGPIKEKFVDPAIDFVTENPLLSTIGGGALLNQFGLPDILTRNIGLGEDVGQNWLGELLGKVYLEAQLIWCLVKVEQVKLLVQE